MKIKALRMIAALLTAAIGACCMISTAYAEADGSALVREYLMNNGCEGISLESLMATYELGIEVMPDADDMSQSYCGGFYYNSGLVEDVLLYEYVFTSKYEIENHTPFIIRPDLSNMAGEYRTGTELGDIEVTVSGDKYTFVNLPDEVDSGRIYPLLIYPAELYDDDAYNKTPAFGSDGTYPATGREAYALGDANHDGTLNAEDFAVVMQYLTGQIDTFQMQYDGGTTWYSQTTNYLAADVNMDGEITLADAEAILELDYFTEAEKPVVMGDINMDGYASMIDAAYMHKYIMNVVDLNEYQMKAADCYADGIININDITILVQHLLEITPELPCVPAK